MTKGIDTRGRKRADSDEDDDFYDRTKGKPLRPSAPQSTTSSSSGILCSFPVLCVQFPSSCLAAPCKRWYLAQELAVPYSLRDPYAVSWVFLGSSSTPVASPRAPQSRSRRRRRWSRCR